MLVWRLLELLTWCGKIHPHVDGQGIPLGVTATGANVHDSRL